MQRPPSPDAQDASPFLAMILGELLELRAMNQAHDLFLRDLLERANNESEEQILQYQQIALKNARRNVYKGVEEMMHEMFPHHLEMVRQLFRETE